MRFTEWLNNLQQRTRSLCRAGSKKAKQVIQKTGLYILKHKKQSGLIAGTALLGVSSVAGASYYYTSNVTSVYHVVLNGKEIGVVSDPSIIKQWTEKRLKDETQKHGGVQMKLSDFITFNEEHSFKGKYDDQAALDALAKEADIKVEAVKVVINGGTIGYSPNEEVAEQLLNRVKERYAGPLGKRSVNAASSDNESNTNIKEVKFKEDVKLEKDTVTAAQVLTEDKLEELLTKGTYKQVKHVVQQGDTISGIASKYGIRQRDIYANNPGVTDNTLLKLGQGLNVTAVQPLVTVQVVQEVAKDEAIPFSLETRTNSSMPKGETRIVQTGRAGKKRVHYQIVKENGQLESVKVVDQQNLNVPIPLILEKGTKVIPSRGSGRLIWPARGYLSSGFGMRWGRMHKGIDIAGSGSIRAADNGRVILAGWNGDYGNCIIIDHGNGVQTLYGHLRSIKVKVGDVVSQGKMIGIMGSTGDSTGVHVHFEVHKNGGLKNPLGYLGR